MAVLFFSYSHKDEALRNELEAHLAMLRNSGLVETWHDRRILAGEPLDDTISAHLERANVILLLVSSDFLNSQYCYSREMKRALERHDAGDAHVIPVILRDCDWQSAPFGRLMAVPKDGVPVAGWSDRDAALADVARQVRRVVERLKTKDEGAAASRTEPVSEARPVRVPNQAPLSSQRPRSSNLRLKKDFTEQERDAFLRAAFRFIGEFFSESLAELKRRNSEVSGELEWVTNHEAVASLYRHGKRIEQCTLRLNGSNFGNGITYSHGTSRTIGSFNEQLTVEATDQALVLRPIMGGFGASAQNERFSQEQAAEHLWTMFLSRLQ